MKRILVLALMICGTTNQAGAHWQFTKWGMTPEQVAAASGGTITIGEKRDSIQSVYEAGGRRYDATFSFEADRLTKVHLALAGTAECEGMARDIVQIYGSSPFRKDIGRYGNAVVEWQDHANGNDVVLGFLVKTCSVTYMRLPSAGEIGL